jgi:hypothetical protein
MPALPFAPKQQSWITNQTFHGPDLGSRRRPAPILDPFPSLVDRRAHTSPVVAAAAVEESGPVSPTLQRPSNEVIGGAFVGAFLGFLILLLLIKCCRDRGRDDSEKDSTISSSTSSGRPSPPPVPPSVHPNPLNPNGRGPLPPPPIYAPPGPTQASVNPSHGARRTKTASRPRKTEAYIAEVEGEPMLVVKRKPRPRRPRRHGVDDLESFSSHSDGQKRGKVSFHLFIHYPSFG